MNRFISLLAAIVSFAGVPLAAQQSGALARVQVTLSFMPVTLPEPLDVRLAGSPDDSSTLGAMFTLNARIRSKEQVYKGAPRVYVLQQSLQGGKSVPLAAFDVPPGVGRAIVFLTRDQPGPLGETKYRAWVLPEKGAGVAVGESVVFNGTGVPLAIELAGRQFTAPPGALPPFSTAALGDKVVGFKAAVEVSGGWQKVADGEMQFPADKRCFLLILPPRKAKSAVVQVFSVYEDVLPAATGDLKAAP